MNFKEIENMEHQASSIESEVSEYQKEIIADYLEKENKKSSAKENPFVYFYEDIIENPIAYDFEKGLGLVYYKNASADALTCINICDDFYRLSSWIINGWLQNALKFIDNIVLHYIQEVLKEIPKKYPNAGVEKSRYKQLSEKTENELRIIGIILEELYDLRNHLEHRTRIFSDGRQEILRPQYNKVRRTVVKKYPHVLKALLKIYKELPD
ncbi:MAG TPA: hypothetical protein VK021_07775 [Flavobacteriaceae bacterium]|nr:hypothetical protein [Flavobacteriaceae bacterium]